MRGYVDRFGPHAILIDPELTGSIRSSLEVSFFV